MTRKLKLDIDHRRRKYTLIESPLYKLKTKRKLAELLRVQTSDLKVLAQHQDNYHVFQQVGRTGKPRIIQYPKDSLKVVHCRIASLLGRVVLPEYLHSGRKEHSHISNAKKHLGEHNVLTTDIKSFFPSTTRKMVFNFYFNILKCSADVADLLASISTFNCHIPTGSQLSMPLAFWSNIRMFEQLYSLAKKHDSQMTVYVDDLTFSGHAVNKRFASVVKKIIHSNGHIAHPSKTRLYTKNEVKIITGVAIKGNETRITNEQHMKIYESLEIWKGCRDEPIIAELIKPKLIGRLNAHLQIDARIKDKINSITSYKPKP
jgi:hypothetical protein